MGQEPSTARESVLRQRPWTVVAALSAFALILGVAKNSGRLQPVGLDFGVFHAGGSLIRSDGYDAAYDTETFTNELTTSYFPALAETETVAHFISTPTFGWFAQGLSVVDFSVALIAWGILGVVAIVAATRMLGLPSWASVALLISPAMAFNTSLGQTGPLVLLLFVTLHKAVVADQRVRAGVLAGLLILKPPLALGYGLFWLVQSRRYLFSMVAAAVTGLVLSLPTLTGGVGPWRGFVDAMSERADAEGAWAQQSPSIPEFLKLLAPQSSTAATLAFWLVGLGGAALFTLAAHRRYGDDRAVMSAVALVATALASPHLLVYDTFFLVIPVAVAYQRGLLTGDRAGKLAAIFCVSLVFGPAFYDAQFQLLERGIGAELPALLWCCWLLVRWDDEALSTELDEPSVAILADA